MVVTADQWIVPPSDVAVSLDWDDLGRLSRAGQWESLRSAMAAGVMRGAAGPAPWPDVGPGPALLEFKFTQMLRAAAALARDAGDVKALFFEVDWDGSTALFLSRGYLPEEDWPADFTQWLDGPRLRTIGTSLDELHAFAGSVFAVFGKALGGIVAEIPWPVGLGIHDGEVLYAPLPVGAMAPEDVPNSDIPVPTGGYYRLTPVHADPFKHPGAEAFDERGVAFVERLHWWQRRASGCEVPTAEQPSATLRLTNGEFEDIIRAGVVNWLLSEPLVEGLRNALGPGDGLETAEVMVKHRDGAEVRRYFACRVSKLVPAVPPAPGAGYHAPWAHPAPAFRRVDVGGSQVFDEDTDEFRSYSPATVSSAVLAALIDADCLVGIRARDASVVDM